MALAELEPKAKPSGIVIRNNKMSVDMSGPSYIHVGEQIAYHRFGHGRSVLLIHECANDAEVAEHLVLVDTIAYDSFPEPGIARLKDPVWDGILSAPDFDLQKGLTKGFTRGMATRSGSRQN